MSSGSSAQAFRLRSVVTRLASTAANQDRCKSLQNSLCAEFQHGFDHHQIASNHGAQLWVCMVARWSKPYNPLCILQETCKRLQLGMDLNTSPYRGTPLICF